MKSRTCDFYFVLERVAWFWRIVGLFPLKMDNGPFHSRKYIRQSPMIAYSILLLLVFLICFSHWLYNCLTLTRSDVSLLNVTLHLRFGWTLVCVLTIISSFLSAIELLAAQSYVLKNLGCHVDHKKNAMYLQAFLWSTMFIMIPITIYNVIIEADFLQIVPFLWPITQFIVMAHIISVTLFICLVSLVGLHFRSLANNLVTTFARIHHNLCLSRSFVPDITIIGKTPDSQHGVTKHLISLAKVHSNLCNVARSINHIYGWNIVINGLTTFWVLTTALYYTFVELRKGVDHMNFKQLCTHAHWFFIYLIGIALIVTACNWTRNQATSAGKFLHQMDLSNTDISFYQSVQSFSLQMHHQKIAFSGAGLFPLDSSLLQSIAAAVTTYLVILIQFESSVRKP
ncbi:Gustatory receptor 7 [Cephus cinctus]|nr:Gustatory receptor 7 [Cephus cinctus]